MYTINKLYNCGIFQGAGKNKHYFEGWYFKHVGREEKNIISVIPGISYEDNRDKAHAFIQIIDGNTCKTHYVRYDIEEFKFSKSRFEFKIGNNSFSADGIELDIEASDISLCGKLNYHDSIHWARGIFSPNSMGWYAFIPVMECYHGVLSMHHNIAGNLILNGEKLNFDGGLGYMEKDWGTSFPSSWVWLQSNHFDAKNMSLMLSIAKIPWRSKSFIGLIAGIWQENKFYKLATYTGAKIDSLRFNGKETRIIVSDKDYEITIEAQPGSLGKLRAPQKGAMTGTIMESIRGRANIKLHDKKTGTNIINADARCLGMEVAGNTQELVSLP